MNKTMDFEINGKKFALRSWYPIPVKDLDKAALLGEHHEIHGIWTVITENREGYSNHPEVKRWVNHLDMLYVRHKQVAIELTKRGMKHESPLSSVPYIFKFEEPRLIEPLSKMWRTLRKKMKARAA